MKLSKPSSISLFLALLSSITCGAALALLIPYTLIAILAGVAACLAVFFVVYVVALVSINRFVIEKITPIYRTVYEMDISTGKLEEKLEGKEVVDEMNKSVERWAAQNRAEIRRLHEMERYRREFLGNVSHELKTPIFNIQGYILTLLDGAMDDPDINRTFLERSEKSINRLIGIVEDLEEISHLDSGELKLQPENFNIIQLVMEVFESMEVKAIDRGVALRLGTPLKDDTVMVHADRKQISQVLINLIDNAIKYSTENGYTTVIVSDMPDRVLVEVEDNGIGVEVKDAPRLFERFYRVDKHRAREQGGSGLGLAIVKHIVEAHHQKVFVRSKVGKGTTFSFTLQKELA